MKKIIKEYQVFNYDELTEKAQEKALNDFYCNNNDFFDFYYDDFKNNLMTLPELENLKFISSLSIEGCDVDYGGYVLLSGEIDIKKYINHFKLEKLKPLLDVLDDETAIIKNNGRVTNFLILDGIHLSYDYYTDIATEKGIGNFDYLVDELQKSLDNELEDLEKIIFKALKIEYDYYTSVDYFKELCDDNNYTFLSNGTMFNE